MAKNWSDKEQSATVLVLGDSLSAAYGFSIERSWVALLQNRLTQLQLPYQVINASVSGETTAGGITRLPGLIAQNQPRWVLIALGANDGLRGTSLQQIQLGLERLIQLTHSNGAQVVLIGVRLPPNYGVDYTEGFQRLYPTIAANMRVALIPDLLTGVADNWQLMQADGLHPTATAQPIIFNTVWSKLQSLLTLPPVQTSGTR
ncbi:arylesterase [Rhodoferax sp. 4810]|uniref:Arylesterase n=1 Tax=Thiospirillum jenense TaxID=1653858 RepID=A0A839HJ69_9GAMM|nr:arylesterase [Thiospirillum jenense]MBB1075468.1 arylesterase [Rhodoferax jenense]MBB1126847.1 arylesterase [Thiospirillum jenense]